jgi:hypothetical protein
MYLGPCAVGCDGEAKLVLGEDGLERGEEVFGCHICYESSATVQECCYFSLSPDSPNLDTEASA